MALLTRANPLEALKLRALISGESKPTKPKAPKRKGKPAGVLVEQLCWVDGVTQAVMVQLPIRLDRDQYNAGWVPHWTKTKTAQGQINTVLLALRTQLRTLSGDRYARERFRSIVLVRISPARLGDDNLIAAFKHVRDGVCAWLKCGDDDFDRRTIGRFDDDVNQPGGIACYYAQTTCQRDKRAHGIQIRLGYSSSSSDALSSSFGGSQTLLMP